mgnify:CR=1 FL=1
MPAARHWRIVGIAARGDVALHTLQLFDGDTRRDAGATLTATHAPVAGALAALQDADASAVRQAETADVQRVRRRVFTTPRLFPMVDIAAGEAAEMIDLAQIAGHQLTG